MIASRRSSRRSIVVVWLSLFVAIVVSSAVTLAAADAVPTPTSETTLADVTANDGGQTSVRLPESLRSLFDNGAVPKSLEELRRLEQQQKRIAAKVAACTVSVRIGQAQGCGVIVTPTGYVLTAAHVALRTGSKAELKLSDGRVVRATTLGMNRYVDAGLMKIDDDAGGDGDAGDGEFTEQAVWPAASLGRSGRLRAGMWCVATGHPGGYDGDRGMVTRVGRILQVKPSKIVTDCALIGGDSGGPLFDLQGRLIAIHSRIGNDVSDNLHVPIDHYNKAWDRLAAGESWGYLEGFKPVLGVRGSSKSKVARVSIVREGSPAEAAGIKPNDVIEQFGDLVITDFKSLTRAVADTMPGERVLVWLNREGTRRRVRVQIGRFSGRN